MKIIFLVQVLVLPELLLTLLYRFLWFVLFYIFHRIGFIWNAIHVQWTWADFNWEPLLDSPRGFFWFQEPFVSTSLPGSSVSNCCLRTMWTDHYRDKIDCQKSDAFLCKNEVSVDIAKTLPLNDNIKSYAEKLTLFSMGDGQKAPTLTSFSPVNSTNIGVSHRNFLTFSFDPFATLV